MTHEQVLSIAVLAGTLGLLIWDKLRYDRIALIALMASIALGIVPANKAFVGFSDQVVIMMVCALVVSKAVSRAGAIEAMLAPMTRYLTDTGRQAVALVGMVTLLSGFMKNIGALSIFMPIALQLSRKTGTSPSRLLMPLAFGSLLGGVMTLIGTSPNIIVARFRQEYMGESFAMFDFLPVGLAISLAGVAFLAFGWRLLPERRAPAGSPEQRFTIQDYLTEVRPMAESPLVGGTVGDLEAMSRGEVMVASLIRDKGHHYIPSRHWKIEQDDVLVLEADPRDLEKLLLEAKLEIANTPRERRVEKWEEMTLIEAVIAPQSLLVGTTIQDYRLRSRHGVNVLALSRAGRTINTRLRRMELRVGDVMVLQGPVHSLPDVLANLGCLPLAHRNLALERRAGFDLSVPILLLAMLAVATGIVSVSVGFFAAALAMVVTRQLSLKEAYEAIDWPIVIMLGALIPVSDALQHNGASDVLAGELASLAGHLPAEAIVVVMLVVAMALTPFLNNAATALVMAPIAVLLAKRLGVNPDALLMAVALGAACDFLTPIGHQCNTLVMGPGGYKFGDYWKLGLPLSLIVIVVGSTVLLFVWPIHG